MFPVKWGRVIKKNGIDTCLLYHTSKEAVKDCYLSAMLNGSPTIGIVNLKTGEEWSGVKLEKIVLDYIKKFG